MIARVEFEHADAFALQCVRDRAPRRSRPCVRRRPLVAGSAGSLPAIIVSSARHIGDVARHRACRVLRMTDRHDMRARNEAHGRFDSDKSVDRCGAGDRSVGFRADRCSGEARGGGCARTRARAAGVAIERVRIARQAAHSAPATDRLRGADVGPLRQVRFAENDRATRAQSCDQRRVAACDVLCEGERAGGRGDRVGGFDVVFHQNRNAVQGATRFSGAAFGVERAGIITRVRIERQNAAQSGACAIKAFDAVEIGTDQGLRRGCARGEIGLERCDGFFFNVVGRSRGRRRGCGHRDYDTDEDFRDYTSSSISLSPVSLIV